MTERKKWSAGARGALVVVAMGGLIGGCGRGVSEPTAAFESAPLGPTATDEGSLSSLSGHRANDLESGIAPIGASSHLVALDAANRAPLMDLRTQPVAVPGNPYPVISGPAPLTVKFNLCRSEDPDEGDSLNWQFHFGDGRPISEGPDVGQQCRTEHTYREGSYVATISLTDKHLEDQDDFGSLARTTQKLTIIAGGIAPADPAPTCDNTISASLDAGGPDQYGRVYRDGIPSGCAGKTYPGLYGGTNVYKAFPFKNASSSQVCVRVDFDPYAGANPCQYNAHASAYLGSYDPADQAANFLGDVGSSVTQPFSFSVPGGAGFLVVVQSTYGPISCDFRFTVVGASCR